MRILMLSWEYPPRIIGGISRVVFYLAKELVIQGHEVTVITVKDNEIEIEENSENVKVYRVDPFIVEPLNFSDGILQMNFKIISKALSLMASGLSYDIIHLHDWLVAYAGNVIKEVYPHLKVVSTFHSTEYGRNTGIHNSIQAYIKNVENNLANLSDKVIVNSTYMKDEINEQFAILKENIDVIPNGVDIDKFVGITCDMEVRRQFASDHEKLVMFVGRLVSEKGIYVLLDAIPKILAEFPDVKFVIAGRGPEMNNLQERAYRLCVIDRLCLPGFISDEMLLKLYKCADIAVFPSLYEPFGIVALEGMVARIPVVVSDTGGLNQIIEHRVNGMKFAAGDSLRLSECIMELLEKPELVKKITENAFKSIKDSYRWQDIAGRTMEIYKSVMGK